MKERCLETRKIYSGRVVALRIDRVMLPSGRKSIREVVEHRGAVAAIPVKGDKIILIRQYRYPVDEVIYEIPAGTREKNETPDETMARELEEEIGYRAGRLTHLFTFYSTPGFTTEKISIYLAEELEPVERRPEHDENIEVVEVEKERIPEMIKNGEIRDGKTIAALCYYMLGAG
ncbi:hypothetical protein DRQ16_02865 [bacterium]|nr:MAG: hypothetical protein DRQ16_02865 [bacterium]